MAVHNQIGENAEQHACDFLLAKGLKLIERNYRYRGGEIDLIMRDQQDIVFVEVRTRANSRYGNALETINTEKQRRILQTSLHFLQKQNWLNYANCRFDVIGITNNHIEWVKNAFTADIL